MLTLILDTVTTAALLFIISSGLLIVFGVMKIINFAHAAFVTVGGYAALVGSRLGLPWALVLPLAFATGAVCGAVTEATIVRWLYQRPLDAILATWGLGIVIGQIITLIFGREVQFVQAPITGTVGLLGVDYSAYRIVMIAAAIIVAVVFTALLSGTRLGLTTRALITPLSSVDPNMGLPWLISAFMLVMVSGGSLFALAASCVVLGGIQVIVSTFVNPILGGLAIAICAAIVLRIRPEGFARA
jgi:branched-chain amino acid transport system permease protein